jgi:hypothetical protein
MHKTTTFNASNTRILHQLGYSRLRCCGLYGTQSTCAKFAPSSGVTGNCCVRGISQSRVARWTAKTEVRHQTCDYTTLLVQYKLYKLYFT